MKATSNRHDELICLNGRGGMHLQKIGNSLAGWSEVCVSAGGWIGRYIPRVD